jgi:hypothetical protein
MREIVEQESYKGGDGENLDEVEAVCHRTTPIFAIRMSTWLTRLHQLNAIFAIFGASDRDKSLDLKGRGLRNRL